MIGHNNGDGVGMLQVSGALLLPSPFHKVYGGTQHGAILLPSDTSRNRPFHSWRDTS
jgi:hypothetical protein